MSRPLSRAFEKDDEDSDYDDYPRSPFQNLTEAISYAWKVVLTSLPQLFLFVALAAVLLFLSVIAGVVVRRSVPKGWSQKVYLQYGDGPMPHANFELRNLVSDQAYDISVHLSFPSTQANFALGNFMTELTLSTANNKTLASVRKPSIFLPQPLPPFPIRLISRPRSVQRHVIPLLSGFTPGVSSLVGLLEIGRRDSWRGIGNGEGREVTIVEAEIVGGVQLRGTRAIVASYPTLSSAVSSALFFVISLLGLIGCFVPYVRWALSQIPANPPPQYKPISRQDINLPRRRTRTRRLESSSPEAIPRRRSGILMSPPPDDHLSD